MSLFVRRNIRRHKQHLPQRVAAGSRLGQCQVSTMYRVEAAAEKADIHSDFPRDSPCDAPLVSSLPVTVASPVTRLCSPCPICTSEFCGKHPMRLGCGQGFSFFFLDVCPPGCARPGVPGRCTWQLYLWSLCRQETAVDRRNSLCVRSAHIMNVNLCE